LGGIEKWYYYGTALVCRKKAKIEWSGFRYFWCGPALPAISLRFEKTIAGMAGSHSMASSHSWIFSVVELTLIRAFGGPLNDNKAVKKEKNGT
jgi:hypothetical protein